MKNNNGNGMSVPDDHTAPEEHPAPDHGTSFEELYGVYADRLNSGEVLDFQKILEAHPKVGEKLVAELKMLQTIDFSPDAGASGKTFGDYTLYAEIGRGGMGIVYDAWQNSLERRVALKVLPAGLAADNKAFIRFMREAKAAAQLTHPNVVHVHDMGVEENTPYYAMEFVEGESLAQVLKRMTEEKEQAAVPPSGSAEKSAFKAQEYDLAYFANLARSFAGVADGLSHAHAKHIIHRDIKPSNLILDADGLLRILDFGLAHFEGHDSLTASDGLVGTPLYMSPEQARGNKVQLDHRTDVYSLGATLYEMTTWQPPFKGKNYKDTLSRIMLDDPVPPKRLNPRIPRDLETIILKCLRKEPDDRYETAEALAQDLRRFVRGDPIEARPQSGLEKFLRRMKRNRLKIGLAALFVLLLGVTLLWGHQYAENKRRGRIEAQQKRLASYREKMHQAAADIELGTMNLHASSSGKNRMDPWETFTILQFQDLLGTTPDQPLQRAISTIESAQPFPPDRYEGYYHLARAYKLLGKLPAALKALDQLATVRPDFVPAHTLAAEIYHDMDQADGKAEAESRASQCAEAPWEKAWIDAYHAEKAQDWKKAAQSLKTLGTLIHDEEPPYEGIALEMQLRRGNALLKTRDFEGALNEFIVAQHAWPEAIEPYILLGNTYYYMDKPDFAGKVFQRLYDSRPPEMREHAAAWIAVTCSNQLDHERAIFWAGRISVPVIRERLLSYYLGLQKQFSASEAAALRAIEASPEDGMSHMMLALALKGQEKFQKAIESCKRAIANDEQFFAPYHVLAMIYYELGRFPEAIIYCKKALALKPGHPNTLSNLGVSLVRTGKPKEGLKLLEESYAIKPDALTCVFIALTLNMLKPPGYIARQEALYEEAARLDPNEQLAWRNWGVLLFEKFGKTEEGLEKMLKAEALNKKIAGIYSSLGMMYEALGEREKSLAHFERAVECQKAAPFQDMSFVMRMGNVLAKMSQYPEVRQKGLALLEEAAKRWSGNHRVLCDYALALTENEQYEKAHDFMDQSLAINDTYLNAHVNLAYLYRKEKKPREALNAYFTAFKFCPPALYNFMYGNIYKMLSEHKDFDFGAQLDGLKTHITAMLKAGMPNPKIIWDLWSFMAWHFEKLDFKGVCAGLEELIQAIPEDKREDTAAYAKQIIETLKALNQKAVLRLNCGGPAYTDPEGVVWGADRFFLAGKASVPPLDSVEDFSGTDADDLFQTCREFPYWAKTGGTQYQGYWIPVIPGDYRVTLFFGETASYRWDRRRFAVHLNGQEVLPSFDTRSLGVQTADTRSFTVRQSGAILEIFFAPKRVGAFVNAIEVERLPAKD